MPTNIEAGPGSAQTTPCRTESVTWHCASRPVPKRRTPAMAPVDPVRCADAVLLHDRILYYYEAASSEGCNELRVSEVPLGVGTA